MAHVFQPSEHGTMPELIIHRICTMTNKSNLSSNTHTHTPTHPDMYIFLITMEENPHLINNLLYFQTRVTIRYRQMHSITMQNKSGYLKPIYSCNVSMYLKPLEMGLADASKPDYVFKQRKYNDVGFNHSICRCLSLSALAKNHFNCTNLICNID